MRISQLRDDFVARLAEFAWSQWSQMGLLAAPTRRDPWAADPEALLLLTFEVGRDEPRLFDEVFDWVVVNERLLSVQRLRNLCLDEADRALVDSVVAAAGSFRRRPRLRGKSPVSPRVAPEPFYRRLEAPTDDPDPDFLAYGLVKPAVRFERRSTPPDLRSPINFAFRLRALLGIGARAEVMRVLLGGQAPRYSVQAITASTGYSKRNVQEALNGLRGAGVIDSVTLGNEQRFSLRLDPWVALFDLRSLPMHVDWPQIFAALRLLLRWLEEPANEDLSAYMLASEARSLTERIAPYLQSAGISLDATGPPGADYWDHFASLVRTLPVPPAI